MRSEPEEWDLTRILPRRSTSSPETPSGEAFLNLESEEADEVFAALSSATARSILAKLHQEPQTASELVDDLDVTLQTVHHHLTKLREAEVIEVVDTWYSARGTEMKVYAPSAAVIMLHAGEEPEDASGEMLHRFGVAMVLGLVFLAFLQLVHHRPGWFESRRLGDDEATEDAPFSGDGPTQTEAFSELIGTLLDIGVGFFLGGLIVVVIIDLWRYHRGNERERFRL